MSWYFWGKPMYLANHLNTLDNFPLIKFLIDQLHKFLVDLWSVVPFWMNCSRSFASANDKFIQDHKNINTSDRTPRRSLCLKIYLLFLKKNVKLVPLISLKIVTNQ